MVINHATVARTAVLLCQMSDDRRDEALDLIERAVFLGAQQHLAASPVTAAKLAVKFVSNVCDMIGAFERPAPTVH